jgi:hypothetical protein
MCGSQSELLAQGVDPKQLLGLISHSSAKEERDQFSVNLQDQNGRVLYFPLPPQIGHFHLLLLQTKKLCLGLPLSQPALNLISDLSPLWFINTKEVMGHLLLALLPFHCPPHF